MTTLGAGADVGARIAQYRRSAGMTASELADRAGTGLSRGVIAHLETGRRIDISVSQLLAIAWALRVPPVALIVDITAPHDLQEVAGVALPVQELVAWIQGTAGVRGQAPQLLVANQLRAVSDYWLEQGFVEISEDPRAYERVSPELAAAGRAGAQARLEQAAREALRLGIAVDEALLDERREPHGLGDGVRDS